MGRLPDRAAHLPRQKAVRGHRLHHERQGRWIKPRCDPALCRVWAGQRCECCSANAEDSRETSADAASDTTDPTWPPAANAVCGWRTHHRRQHSAYRQPRGGAADQGSSEAWRWPGPAPGGSQSKDTGAKGARSARHGALAGEDGPGPGPAKVGKNVIEGNDLGAGIVEATLEELTGLPRPPGVADPNQDAPLFQDARAGVTEITVWRIEATIIALKHEPDGDYHMVLQGASGAMMVAEIPTPTRQFVGDSPWLANIGEARQEVDDKLVKKLSRADFALLDNRLVRYGAVTFQPHLAADTELSFHTPPEGSGA